MSPEIRAAIADAQQILAEAIATCAAVALAIGILVAMFGAG